VKELKYGFSLAVDGGEWSASRTGRFTPGSIASYFHRKGRRLRKRRQGKFLAGDGNRSKVSHILSRYHSHPSDYVMVGNVTNTKNMLKKTLAVVIIEVIVRKALLECAIVQLILQADRTESFNVIFKIFKVPIKPPTDT
jgi:hypothetical protein